MLSPGVRVGPYAVVSPLGAGGMGEVWRAHDTRLGRDVALKALPDRLAENPARVARLQREARILASVSHPHVAVLHGVEDAHGTLVLVMELVEGATLFDRLRRGPLGIAEALRVAIEIAEGLEAAHTKGILHRDLKPGNVRLTAQGQVKILDFGLAKWLEPEDETLSEGGEREAPATGAGTVMGTPAYMAPEQARGEDVDKRADVWAFGCVLFELLTGKPVFAGNSTAETLADVLHREPEWNALPPDTPPAVTRLLKRCLRKSREDRLRDIGDARLELEEAGELARETLEHPRGPRAARRWTRPAFASLALLSILAGLGALLARSGRQPDRPVTRFALNVGTGSTREWHNPLAISPDGSRLAYCSIDDKGRTQLNVRELDALEATPLGGTEGGRVPFFSPDGRWIGFQTSRGALAKVSTLGGSPVEIARISVLHEATWGGSDRIVFSAGYPSRLWWVAAAGGDPAPLTVADSESISPKRLLRDGKSLLAFNHTRDGTYLELLSVESGKTRRILRMPESARGSFPGAGANLTASGHFVYSDGDTLLAVRLDPDRWEARGTPLPVLTDVYSRGGALSYFAVSDSGTLAYVPGSSELVSLVWVDRHRSPTPVPGGPAPLFGNPYRISPDGSRAVVVVAEGTGRQIWVYDLASGARRRLTWEGEARCPVWSPDGKRVAFQWNQGVTEGIFEKAADGSGRVRLLLARDARRPFPNAWSPDGRSLVFMEVSTGADFDLWTWAPGAEPSPLLAEDVHERELEFSPDGRWITFVSNESGQDEVYLQPYPAGGTRTLVSAGGGRWPVWSPTGREIFYQLGDGGVMALAVATVPTLRLGRPRLLFEGPYRLGFDVSRDGERFLMAEESPGPAEIRVVVNWSEELKRDLP